MSMVGVKQRLEEEYDILIDRFSTYHSKVNNKYKGFTANLVKEAFDWNDDFMKKE